MRNIVFLLGIFLPIISSAQECEALIPDVKVMGLEKRSSVNLDDMEPVTLPVVFHIVHKGEGDITNISDEQILSQIPALDTGFRFGPGVDTKIQFCLASRDPDGNPTNGITRHNGVQLFGDLYDEEGITSSSFFDGVNDNLLKSTVGCWNPDEYINFYVVSEIQGNDGGNGIQGYAYIGGYANGPNGGCGDGIVQLYNVTGTTGTLKSGREQGETAVHEMGHHLDLWHTFSNSNDCFETNCETQGDMVCDTPPTQSNQGCSTFSSGCDDAMVENFMDYTSEICRETFSVGQAERMWEHLLDNKQALINSLSCLPPVDYDLEISSAFYQPTWCTDFQDIWVTITNLGSNVIGIAEVEVLCNGEEYSETVFDIGQGAGTSILFEQVFVGGAQNFQAQVTSAEDQYEFNDVGVFPIETLPGDLLTIEVYKDFWGCIGWELLDPDGEVVIGDDYNSGEGYYSYDVCVYEGCYTIVSNDCAGDGFCTIDFDDDGICDIGSEGIVGTVAGDTVFATGFGLEFFEWSQEWCNTLPACAYDLDANGTIGNGDVVVLLSNYGCVGDCTGDLNGDGIVSVLDLLEMLTSIGDCPVEVEEDFSIGIYKDLVTHNDGGTVFGGGTPKIYDLYGRRVDSNFNSLAKGFYILKWRNKTKKIYIQ